MVNRRPKLELIAPSASPAQVAAIVATLERFMRDTAPQTASSAKRTDPWVRIAMLEGVSREGRTDEPEPWINT